MHGYMVLKGMDRVTVMFAVQGKVVFVAPTKPLVNQQIQACYEFMGVSKVCSPAGIDSMPSLSKQVRQVLQHRG